MSERTRLPADAHLYLDKELAGHSLMQVIARVNRVYGEKPGGLVVDLLWLADQLAEALVISTQAGGRDDAAPTTVLKVNV